LSGRPIFRDIIDPNSAAIRQQLITKIQQQLNPSGCLLVYTANPGHPFALIMNQDTPLFEDLLRTVDSKVGYLMITSPGGDPNAAEKVLIMCRERFTEGFFVIVPNYAKSAATMLALGSDTILMGYLAELGPIDPQIQLSSPLGPSLPARSFIDGLENIRTKVKKDGDPVQMYLPMLSQIKPEIIAICLSAIEDSRSFAEKWLKKCMLKNDPKQAEYVADWLSKGEKYKSHGKVIGFQEAKDILKLMVDKIDKDSELWDCIWELYLRSTLQLQLSGGAKLFENEKVSLTLNIDVATLPQPREKRQLPPPRPEQSKTE
jgi:hypothetical protein